MSYVLTTEQEAIIAKALEFYNDGSVTDSFLKVEAVAGSSKTFTSIKVADALQGKNCLYLAYNKAIAEEASTKFPKYVECKTTHSIAYAPIVKYGLDLEGLKGKARQVSFFNYKDIKEAIPYEDKLYTIEMMEKFFVSRFLDVESFASFIGIDLATSKRITKYVDAMVKKTSQVTHGFYLKMFHILLATEHIHYDKPYDLLILDEAGDVNEVTLEIVKLLPAKVKFIVGDSLQNIYSFNGTINAFKALKEVGSTLHLSQSFRCSTAIANDVQYFINEQLDPNIDFFGTEHPDKSIITKAVIARTNSGLIEHMIIAMAAGDGFNMVREVKEIFNVVLILINLAPTSKIYDSRYKDLVYDAKVYEGSPTLRERFKDLLGYIASLHSDFDPAIASGIAAIRKYGRRNIWEAYNAAKGFEAAKRTYPLTLTTAHSSKGLTFDSVTLADDFKLDDILSLKLTERTEQDREELRLYYVACTRARVELNNAKYLRS